MNDFLAKIEDFLFDIMGLVLPGFVFLGLLSLPFFVINLITVPQNTNFKYITLFNTLHTLYIKTHELAVEFPTYFGVFLIIIAYISGHFVKVFAIIIYDFGETIFDKTLIPFFIYIFRKTQNGINYIINKIIGRPMYSTRVYEYLKIILSPFLKTLTKIFYFSSPKYFSDNEELKKACVNEINSKLSLNYPNKWYSIYKFSSIINSQEKNKSLAPNFLAKYNLYRSLSFIFLFIFLLYLAIFSIVAPYIKSNFIIIKDFSILTCLLLWFTFHYKYKRYWTLCGNENLVSLFYFLNKKKINA